MIAGRGAGSNGSSVHTRTTGGTCLTTLGRKPTAADERESYLAGSPSTRSASPRSLCICAMSASGVEKRRSSRRARDELHAEGVAEKVDARRSEEVDLDLPPAGVLEGGADADAGDGGAELAHTRPAGVDAIGRGGFLGRQIEVSGGETERTPTVIAGDDGPRDLVPAPEEVAGGVDAARGDEFANVGAADDAVTDGDVGHRADLESEFRGEPAKQISSALAPGAEAPAFADDEAAGVELSGENLPREVGGRSLGERTIEGGNNHETDAELSQQGEFLNGGAKQRRRAAGGDDGIGMGVEGEYRGEAAAQRGHADGLGDDCLMPDVDAVEDAHGQA